jgi:hypothetical protein
MYRAFALSAAIAIAAPAVAVADEGADAVAASPPFRFSIGAGGAALIAGADGETWRGLAAIDIYPGGPLGRFGASLAVRSLLLDPFGDAGLATAGVIYEAAAARPRLVMALHGEGGVAFADDRLRPAVGGGLKTHLGVIGPLALASDVTLHIVAQAVDDYDVVVSLGALIAIAR